MWGFDQNQLKGMFKLKQWVTCNYINLFMKVISDYVKIGGVSALKFLIRDPHLPPLR